MTTYQLYEIRRCVLAETSLDVDILRAALVITDHIDWHTKSKTCQSAKHMTNWLKSMGDQYGIPAAKMNKGVDYLCQYQFMTVETIKGRVVLAAGPVPD